MNQSKTTSQYNKIFLYLRKLLLNDYIYIILILSILILTIIRLLIPTTSSYNELSTHFTGIINKITIKDDKLTLYIKNKETIIAYLYLNDKEKINVNLGDKVKIEGQFIKPSSNTTDYLFNYKKYLERRNIFYLVKIDSIKVEKHSKNIYYLSKQKLINRLNNNKYLYTFILGDKSYLDSKVKRSYQENGISHLFAISGMHISLLVLLITKVFSKFKIKEESLFKIISVILLIYLSLVGLSPSIVRGVLFYLLFSINNMHYFYIKPLNIFLTIVSISLLINPNYIFDIGYLYSYSISLSLLILTKYLNSNSYFINLFKVSTISFLVSIPITLANFYQINILSIIYNLFFVPFVSIIIFPLSLLVVIFSPLESIYNFLITVLENISLYLGTISFGKLIFKRLPLVVYIIYFLIILVFIFKPKKIFIVILSIFLTIHYIIPYIDKSDYLKMIDVGQGDSILLHSDNKNILIDTGGVVSYSKNLSGTIFYNTTFPLLRSEGIKKIDYLILTHGDYDHMGEAINLVSNFKVEKVIFNCGEYNYLEKKLIKLLDKKRINYYTCISELNIDNNKLSFLQTKDFNDENDNSNVIYTELNGYRFMFMGDASSKTEKEILKEYELPNIDVLKVGHHGSRTSSSKEFINEINPKYSLISVGKDNKFNHPNKETLDNLKASKIYRTDEYGTITLKIKNNKLKIETCSP